MMRPTKLPAPDPLSATHSINVTRHILQAIESAGGAIPFEAFMNMALYAPGVGYYSAGARKFGKEGDYVTAPQLSPLFSHCVARQAAQVLCDLNGADVLEVGAGTGVMACDMLLELEALQQLPERYFILEVSADLRDRQRTLLNERAPHLVGRVYWLDALPQAEFRGVIVGNELLDALPVQRFSVQQRRFCQSYVSWSGERFVWQERPLSEGSLLERLNALRDGLPPDAFPPGYVSEVNVALDGWISSVADALKQGVVLLFDYGYPRREYYLPDRAAGTIMCHYRHIAHPDPLIYPGIQDITAHVDFTALAQAGEAAGLDLKGYTTQAFFLLASGLEQIVAQSDPRDTVRHLRLVQQVKTLTMPSEMGELFKVMALGRGYEGALSGFSMRDLRGKL